MKLLMPVLKKNESWEKHMELLDEEQLELKKELNIIQSIPKETVTERIVEEALDVIQICIGILDKAEREFPGIVCKKNGEHNGKLITRGWGFSKVLRVDED